MPADPRFSMCEIYRLGLMYLSRNGRHGVGGTMRVQFDSRTAVVSVTLSDIISLVSLLTSVSICTVHVSLLLWKKLDYAHIVSLNNESDARWVFSLERNEEKEVSMRRSR